MSLDSLHNGHPLKEGYLLSENLEMYLKNIYRISREKKVARVKDLSIELKVSKSSVTKTLKVLSEKGFIDYDPYSFISLTKEGNQLAEKISHKYEVLRSFFYEVLKVPKEVAQENACRGEHVIDDLVFKHLENFLKKQA